MESLQHIWAKAWEYPSSLLLTCFAGLYFIYYLAYVVQKPKVACGGEKLKKLINEHCPIVKEKFWPTWWCFEARFQTVLRAFLQPHPNIQYKEEFLQGQDGGEIRVDWVENEEDSQYPSATRPTILMLPGLTGSSKENYILIMADNVKQLGYRCVVFNNRGTGDTKLTSPRTYCAANTEDLELVISHVKNKYPLAPFMGVGVSLGGMLLFNYLAKMGERAQLDAMMCISPGWDVFACVDSLDQAINYYLFNRTLAKGLVYMVKKNIHFFTHMDTDHIMRSESIKDFDERFTSKVFGYDSVDQYYQEASLHTKVHAIAKPTLCLCALDDPFAPAYSIPVKDAEQNENLAIILTSHGGHIGFLEGAYPRHESYMYRWFRQYIQAIFNHGIKQN